MGVECLARRTVSRKVCVSFLCCGCSCAYVCIILYAAGHGKECVTEMVSVESADSPLSAMAGVKAPPRGTGVCKTMF